MLAFARRPSTVKSLGATALLLALATLGASAQTDFWNSNAGDQTTALSGNYSTGTDWSTGLPTASSAVQINSVSSGNGNQTVTFNETSEIINSLTLSEDVSGVTNELSETAPLSGTSLNTLLALTAIGSGTALSLNASNGGTAEISISGSVSGSGGETLLDASGSGGSIALNAAPGSTAEILVSSPDDTAIELGSSGRLIIGNGGGGTTLVALTGNSEGVSTYIESSNLSYLATVTVNLLGVIPRCLRRL